METKIQFKGLANGKKTHVFNLVRRTLETKGYLVLHRERNLLEVVDSETCD